MGFAEAMRNRSTGLGSTGTGGGTLPGAYDWGETTAGAAPYTAEWYAAGGGKDVASLGNIKDTAFTDKALAGSTEQPGFFGKDGFGMSDALGIGKLGVGLGQLYLGQQGLDLAKDTFAANKADRDRTYAANVAKYNNALARTAAVDKHYGSTTAGQRLGQG